jgi:hypothetical protein
MLDGLFLFFIALAAVYLLVAPRKEFPLVMIMHTVLQYALTMLAWSGALPPPIAVITMGCMWSAALFMVWVRSWQYSPRLKYVGYMTRVMQWGVLLFSVLDMVWNGNAGEMLVGHSGYESTYSLLYIFTEAHRFIGNILVFFAFLQITLHWGQQWAWQKSLWDLMPVVSYFLLVLVLRLLPVGEPLTIN